MREGAPQKQPKPPGPRCVAAPQSGPRRSSRVGNGPLLVLKGRDLRLQRRVGLERWPKCLPEKGGDPAGFARRAIVRRMDELAGKVAVITGAGSGLGRALAHRLGSAGMRVVLADIDANRLNDVGGELDDAGVEVATLITDVSKRSQVEGLADLAYEQFGAVNLLCNNAGVAVVGPAWECTDADWAWAIGVNLWGVIHGLQAFLPRMLKAGEPGHIVNTASLAGILAPPLSGPYVATKHAVVGMTESLFHDLALRQAKIGCSVLAPGFVKTGIATSESVRPDELKNPIPSTDPLMAEVGKYYANEVARGIPAEAVAEAVHEAILEGRFYVFTHPEMTAAFADRFSRMVAGKNPKTRPLAASLDDERQG